MNISNYPGSSNRTNVTENSDVSNEFDRIFIVYGIITPVIVAFGYFGNILTAIVLWKKEKSSTNTLLLRALVLSDITILTDMFLFLSVPTLISGLIEFDLGINVIQNQGFTAIDYIFMTSQQLNVYILVFISIERYLAVCHPLKHARGDSPRRTIAILCGIVCCSMVYNTPRIFATVAIPANCMDVNFSLTCYRVVYTDFGESYFYREVYSVWMYGALFFVIPLCVLLIMNIFIIKELTKMRRARKNLGVTNSANKKDSITVSLVIIMAVFFAVQTLGFFNQFPKLMKNMTGQSGTIDLALYLYIVNVFYVVNSSINILIYAAVGQKFRKNVSELFKTRFRCPKLRIHSSDLYTVTESSRVQT